MGWKRGAYPEYTLEDAVGTIFLLKELLGRKQISELLDLGEGSVRTLLRKLTSNGLIGSKQRGHFLTKKGEALREELLKEFSEPVPLPSVDGYPACGIVIRRPGPFKSLELRDEAIRFRARGALILLMKDGKIVFPEDERPLADTYPELDAEIMRRLSPEGGDLVVVTWADEPPWAFKSAIHVALFLKGGKIPGELKEVIR
ncbi:DUF4443 domain-containing protein [Pyrococcus yayanosii]|uniref:Uncharacterized protein n=1 Tax=Pyrococcus yayanosii (strain CH1 / JCM 16557) TaxID=529709 RepID=F8AGM3_PYRYC|nr:DUF4443 domain-containing protein [Pyrococcus yayanosii]AEH23994.1 hypothetical protein PYCH_02970 [Pyrococcus yayanosii CH1]